MVALSPRFACLAALCSLAAFSLAPSVDAAAISLRAHIAESETLTSTATTHAHRPSESSDTPVKAIPVIPLPPDLPGKPETHHNGSDSGQSGSGSGVGPEDGDTSPDSSDDGDDKKSRKKSTKKGKENVSSVVSSCGMHVTHMLDSGASVGPSLSDSSF